MRLLLAFALLMSQLSCVTPMMNSDGSVVQLLIFIDESGKTETNKAPPKQLHQIADSLQYQFKLRFREGVWKDGTYLTIEPTRIYRRRNYIPDIGRYLLVVRLDDYVQRGVILEATASLYEGDDAEPFFEQSYHESGKHWHDLTADLGRHVKTDVFNLLIERTSNSP